MSVLFVDEHSGAKFSEDRKYRYFLYRKWNLDGQPLLMLIGLNPSTAREEKNDQTINKIILLAKNNGYGGFYMTNLFPFITAYPEELEWDARSIIQNDYWLDIVRHQWCRHVCFCWGNFYVHERDRVMIDMFPGALCFGKNKNGSPKHPLYLKKDTKLIKY